ncbi:MAG: hypothetical protein WBA89_00620 [Microcoleus sp.]
MTSILTFHLLEQISPATYINPEDDRTLVKLLHFRLKQSQYRYL